MIGQTGSVRVCVVSRRYWPAVSGMSIYAENLVRELTALGHEVVMISQYRDDERGTAVYGGGPPPPERIPDGVRVVARPSVGEAQIPADWESDIDDLVDRITELHAQAPFDVLHAQYAYPTGLAVLEASRRLGVPNAVSIQGGDGHWVGTCCTTHKVAMDAVLDHAGAVLIGCRSFADEVTGHHGTAPERFTIVPGATDTARFHPDARPPGALSELPVLLFHGRVDARKGVLDLLAALPDDARLVISGVGPDLDAAKAMADGRTTFLGYVDPDDAPAVYRSADVFVSPTYSEGFSNTILEAMATGLPVVSTNSVGVIDCLTHEVNGLLHGPGDVEGLRAALRRMLDDASLRARLATTALDEARRLYSWPVLAANVEAVYDTLKGTDPDDGWVGPTDADLSCRFRAAAHLL